MHLQSGYVRPAANIFDNEWELTLFEIVPVPKVVPASVPRPLPPKTGDPKKDF